MKQLRQEAAREMRDGPSEWFVTAELKTAFAYCVNVKKANGKPKSRLNFNYFAFS
jgi:hypothetical protein